MGVRIHEKYGLNPTMPICIICRKEKGEIALLGASYKEQAPMKMLLDIEPCQDCRKKYLSNGVLLVEVEVEYRTGKEHKIPTGNIVVIKTEAFSRIFEDPIPSKNICMVEVGVLQKLQE